MSEVAFDSSAYFSAFKAEANEYLVTLSKGLLSLEKNPRQPDIIQALFRAAHTLKGAARMMGYQDIQDAAHHLEDQFGKIKGGESTVTEAVINESLKLLDNITTQLNLADQKMSSSPDMTVVPVLDPVSFSIEEYIRIPVSRVDTLLNLVGELLIYKAESSAYGAALRRLSQHTKKAQQRLHRVGERISRLLQNTPQDAEEVMQLLHHCHLDAEHWRDQVHALEERILERPMHLDTVMDELQFKTKQLRMLPCATIFDGFERLVRDIAKQEKKKVSLQIEGAQTELDKKVLEGIKPCLIHLLRNAVDHGLESTEERIAAGKPALGTIHLRASQQGNKVLIEVQDDGRGIDLQKIKDAALQKKLIPENELHQMDDFQIMDLIFVPGLSTRSTVTDISGRGVGMDVVRDEIEQLKGQVLVTSELGKGSTITLELPLTIAIVKVLVLETRGQAFGMPVERIEEIVYAKPDDVQFLGNRKALRWRDRTIALIELGDALGLPPRQDVEGSSLTDRPQASPIIIACQGTRRMGFQVDHITGEEEVLLKSTESQLGKLTCVSGVTILGTGDVLVILNPADLINTSQKISTTIPPLSASTTKQVRNVLVVDDSLTSREMERTILEAHGYHVQTAIDGLDALEKLAQKSVDLVVSDVEMPRMGGFELCKSLRQRQDLRELPVIFVTSLDTDEEKRRGIEAGAQAYIVKGRFDQNNLLETIKRLIG